VSRVRVGVVGAGFAAASHIEALRRVPGVEIAGITASTPERSKEAASRLDIVTAYEGYEEMAAAPDIDAIHNCAPNDLHLAINKAVLAAGKHLLSEKPLGLTSDETREIARLAKDASVVTGVCHNYRHFPLVRQAKDMLSSGDHGTPHFVHGTYLQDWLLHPDDWNWRLETEKAGRSRAVADIGSHWMDLAQYVIGSDIERVSARTGRLHEQRIRPEEGPRTFETSSGDGEKVAIETEDMAVVMLQFASGALGALSVSQVSPGRKNALRLMIDTDQVGLGWDQEEPNTLWIGRRDLANSELARDPGLLAPEAAKLAHYPGGHQEGWPDALKNLIADFYSAVAGNGSGSSFATFEDAHHVTRVVEAIMESAGTERWVEVEREEIA
jgi:predicted dehydrogenase